MRACSCIVLIKLIKFVNLFTESKCNATWLQRYAHTIEGAVDFQGGYAPGKIRKFFFVVKVLWGLHVFYKDIKI